MLHQVTLLLLLYISPSHQVPLIPPPRLDTDIAVNQLLSQNMKKGGFILLEPNTELVSEHPPGSGRVVVLQTGPEFLTNDTEEVVPNDITRELLVEAIERPELEI